MKTKTRGFESITEVTNYFLLLNIKIELAYKDDFGYVVILPNGLEFVGPLDLVVLSIKNYINSSNQYTYELKLQYSN